MAGFLVFNRLTGQVLRTGDAPKTLIPLQAISHDEAVMNWSSGNLPLYVDIPSGRVLSKTRVVAEPEIEGLTVTLSGLPVPCVLQVENGMRTEILDGLATIEFNLPGEYVIRCDSVQFLQRTWTVTL